MNPHERIGIIKGEIIKARVDLSVLINLSAKDIPDFEKTQIKKVIEALKEAEKI